MTLSIAKLNYYAGLFDGEGTVRIVKVARKEPTYSVWVSINMCDAIMLKELFYVFGGSFYHYDSKNSKHRDLYSWIITTKKAYNFLKEIYPYAVIKKEQIRLALELQENIFACKGNRKYGTPHKRETIRYRERMRKRMKKMKHISINGSLENWPNSGDGCDANPELNSEKSDKCVETRGSARKGWDSPTLQKKEL